MAENLFVLFLLTVSAMLSTLATVLLVRLFTKRMNAPQRALAGALIGPLWVAAPLVVSALNGGQIRQTESQITLAIILVVCFAVGWIVSHFATRRLDRVTRFDPHIFE